MTKFKGRDPATGESYEDKFCNNTGQMGIALLGDSIGAHFHLPEQWLGWNRIESFNH
jgi:acyloxyacyl hydrolase